MFSLVSFAGCSLWQNETGEEHPFTSPGIGAATGAAIGAVGGAIIGSTSGHVGEGMAIGSLAGAAAGGAVGYRVSSNETALNENRASVARRGAQIKEQRREISTLRRNLNDNEAEQLLRSGRPSVVRSVAEWKAYHGSPNAKPISESRAMLASSPAQPAIPAPRLRVKPSAVSRTGLSSEDIVPAQPVSPQPIPVETVPDVRSETPKPVLVSNVAPSKALLADAVVPAPKALPAAPAPAETAAKIAPKSALPPMKSVVDGESTDSSVADAEDDEETEADDSSEEPVKDDLKQALKSKIDSKAAEKAAAPKNAEAALPTPKTALAKAETELKGGSSSRSEEPKTESCVKAKDEADRARQAKSIADRLFYYRRALRLCPESSNYHYEIGKLYGVIGRTEDAKEEFKQALARNSGNADARHELSLLEKE